MDFEGQKSTLSMDDVNIDSNVCIAHLNDGHDLDADGHASSEHYLTPKNSMGEAEELNSNDNDENFKLYSGYGSFHSNRSTPGDYVDAVSLVGSVEKNAENGLNVAESLGSHVMSPPSSGAKGKGLRKWRRIMREFVRDGGLGRDPAKILKRGLEDLANPEVVIAEMKQKSEQSELSVDEVLLHNVLNTESFSVDGIGSRYKMANSATLSAGTGSDKDRNSRSSTVVSVSKSRHDIPSPSGHSLDKNKTKPMSGMYSVNATQRMQHDLSNVDASKKPRGEAINLHKENSPTSRESDSGSYSSPYMNCPTGGITDGKSDRGEGYDGEHGNDGPAGGHESIEELPTSPSRRVFDEKILQGDSVVPWKVKGRVMSHQISGKWDPLVDCVQILQFTQNTLEQELQKFGELDKDLQPFDDDSIWTRGANLEFCAASSSESLTSEELCTEIPDALKGKSLNLSNNAKILEKQAEQAMGMLKEKETKITELEAMINNLKSSNEELGRSIDAQQKKYEEIEAEGDTLFKLKMEAEIQYTAVADLSILAENMMKLLLTEQKFLVSAHEREMSKVSNLERKAVYLKYKAEAGLTMGKGTAWAGKTEKSISKFTFCFFIQLSLLVFVYQFFKSQFQLKTIVVLPT